MPRSSTRPPGELLQGTLPLLILRTLATGPNHGFAIARRIQQISQAVLRIEQGSLYPALHRLERRGLIKARWGTSENNRKAKFYEITKAGRRQLEIEQDAWQKLTTAVSQILETA
jgi:transcriptional regulator